MSSPRARSRNSARAVRKMIGISAVRSSSSSASATPQPSSPGIITSRRITSGCSARAFSSPDGPSPASTTGIPSASRFTRQSSRIGASSSITSTVVIRLASYPWVSCLTLSCTELEDERRALAFGRVDPDPAAHRRDEPLGEEEPQTRRAGPDGSHRRFATVELAEDPLLVRVRDPDALILDAHLDGVLAPARSHRDRPAGGRVPDRVVQQMRQDLRELVTIGLGGEWLVPQLDHEAVAVLAVRSFGGAHRLADDGAHV